MGRLLPERVFILKPYKSNMLKFLKVSAMAVALLLTCSLAMAQEKIGYINLDQVISLMPEAKALPAQLESYRNTFNTRLTTMSNELQSKSTLLQERKSGMTDAARTAAESEIQELGRQFNTYQLSAQQAAQAKTVELTTPVIQKARLAVAAVAKEGGYTCVINTAQTDLIVPPQTGDLTAAVKARLGL
jgi:outer membrane protein